VTQEQVESQLSAMFDGELPAAECELLSRRIDRDENLRARWSRYALIGAAMRSEPVATARRGFASRVSAALDVSEGKQPLASSRKKRTVWNTALAASLVATVAGISIGMLRYSTPAPRAGTLARSSGPAERALPERPTTAAPLPVAVRAVSNAGRGEPYSYKTPVNSGPVNFALRTQLADYIVAHSEYSTPLMRRSLLSTLVSSEDDADGPMPLAVAADPGHLDAAPAASSAGR
jgi:sigma-E factor negative regulatory protein RseA